MSVRTPFVIGHRGAAARAPENTLASIRMAATLGASWVEFDVRLSRDGCPILFHDDDLDRTSNGRGPVADHDLAGLKALDAGAWFDASFRGEPIPTLDEAIDTLAELGIGANVEIKPDAARIVETAEMVATILRRRWPSNLPVPLISSFQPEATAVARRMVPAFDRAMLVGRIPGDWRRCLKNLDCNALHCSARYLSRVQAETLVAEGVQLRCYTVNDPKIAKRLAAWGVEAMFTDDPEVIASCSISLFSRAKPCD